MGITPWIRAGGARGRQMESEPAARLFTATILKPWDWAALPFSRMQAPFRQGRARAASGSAANTSLHRTAHET